MPTDQLRAIPPTIHQQLSVSPPRRDTPPRWVDWVDYGKGTHTPVTLARDLPRPVPDTVHTWNQVRVLADSRFEAAAFLDEVQRLGFEFVVGVRSTRCTEHPSGVTVADGPHGGSIELQNWPHDTLTPGRVRRGQRVFHALASESMDGDEVISEEAQRWQIESFLKESKHRFGLNRFAHQAVPRPETCQSFPHRRWVGLARPATQQTQG